MMYTTPRMKKLYSEIQQKLFYMIPEKWDKVYLYASVTESINKVETGEMYFYYFPKGILKKNPVNVYEVPNKFNIDEQKYYKLADELYGIIKKLRAEYINMNDRAWTNVTISIENFKFKVEYKFEDLKKSQYNSYDRHIIFRYMYLNTSLNTYNKKERAMIESYMRGLHFKKEEKETYTEPIYKIEQNNNIDYQKEDEEILVKNSEKANNIEKFNYEIGNEYYLKKNKSTNYYSYMKKVTEESEKKEKLEKTLKKQVNQVIEETNNSEYKNQILNFDNKN